jgi:hypothetical protein
MMRAARTAFRPPPFVRSLGAGAAAAAGAWFLARWLDRRQSLDGWFFFDLATIWLWQLVFIAACLGAGWVLVRKLLPVQPRSRAETVALSFSAGVVLFVLGMYVGGALHIWGPVFATALPIVMLAIGARPALAAWRSAREAGTVPTVSLTGLPLVAAIAGLLGVGLLYLGAMAPDALNYDSTWVHLVIAQDYAREGRIVGFPGNWQLNVPHLASVVYAWGFMVPGLELPALRWMMALHSEFVMVVFMLVGIAAAVRWLAERYARGAWAAYLLFPGIFVYDSNIGGSADHFASMFVAPLLLITARVARRFDRGTCLLWGALAGGAFLSKVQSFYFLVPLTLGLLARTTALIVEARRHPDRDPTVRALVTGWALMGAACFLVLMPHLVSNFIFFRNPVYPLLLNVFTGSRPVVKDAVLQANYIMADWHWRSPPGLGAKLTSALELFFTFSFEPHYSFVDNLPVFGSTFTLSLPLLLFVGRAPRIWLGALASFGAIMLWALTYWVDRNLQVFLPLLIAVTAALMVRAWELGWLARAGVVALVLVQTAWGSALYFSGTDRMTAGMRLLRSGMQGRAEEQLRSHRADYVALGASLPKSAKVLLHDSHLSLGIDRPVYLDWVGYQAAIDYSTFRTPRDFDHRLRELGITHVVFLPGVQAPSTKQAEIIFDVFRDRYGRSPTSFGGLALFPMPAAAPPQEPPYQVLSIGVPELGDGLYPIEALGTVDTLPPQMKHVPPPSRTAASPAELLDAARVAIIGSGRALDPATSERLQREFREVQSQGGYRVLVRNP